MLLYPGIDYILKIPLYSHFEPICFIHVKCLDFNDFEVIYISKKHKNINNKQKYSNLFVTEFDKTLILSQFELFFNILKQDFNSQKQPSSPDKHYDSPKLTNILYYLNNNIAFIALFP